MVDGSTGAFVASHVLHRFLAPRHPPCALKNLATDARVHCAVLKQRPPTHTPEPTGSSALGPASEGDSLSAAPSDTQQRARPDPPWFTFHAEAVLVTLKHRAE